MLEFESYKVTFGIDEQSYFCNTLGVVLPKAQGAMYVNFYDRHKWAAADYAIVDERMYIVYEEPNFYL